MAVLSDLRCLQLDPIRAVECTQYLVLWSRLGVYDLTLLNQLLFDERRLFEYWAHCASIVLTEDYPIHALRMAEAAASTGTDGAWTEANDSLRRHILELLADQGPLASDQFEDRADVSWWSSGWTSNRNVARMLDFLWDRGDILVAHRKGTRRFWDLGERVLPSWTPREPLEGTAAVSLAAEHALRALGIGTARQIKLHFTRHRYPHLPTILERLEETGRIERIRIAGEEGPWPGVWYVHADRLPLLEAVQAGEWAPRTTLLSPFDNLICDRDRTKGLFGFDYRIEIYVPAAKRRYGYYVLPILDGDRLIGRLDAKMERKVQRLAVNAIYAEPDALLTAEAGRAIAAALEELAAFLGAADIFFAAPPPDGWRKGMGL